MWQPKKCRRFAWGLSVLSTSLLCYSLSGQESQPRPASSKLADKAGQPATGGKGNSNITLVAQADQPPAPPPTPSLDIPAPEVAAPTPSTQQQPTLQSANVSALSQAQQSTYTSLNDIVSGGEAVTRGTTDVGDLLGKSIGALGVEVQRRTPIITDPRVRGYQGGQIVTTADGGFFFPARPDLDTIVSRIDSALVDNIIIIKGPYTVRQGPGFAFIDIETLRTPRYENGFEGHGSTSVGYKTNGQGWSGRQSVWGGDSDWGYRIGWDILAATNYVTGAGVSEPSGYNMQNFDVALGFDFNENFGMEFKYFRTMQRDVQFPGALADLNSLTCDVFDLRLAYKEGDSFRSTLDTWYNHTGFNGDNLSQAKRNQIPALNDILNDNSHLRLDLTTNGDNNSWGFRSATTLGRDKEFQVTGGLDFRYTSQAINEFDTLFFPNNPSRFFLNSPVPRARQLDPGLFLDTSAPVGDQLSFKAGARFDFINSAIQQPLNVPQPEASFPGNAAFAVNKDTIATDLGSSAVFDTRHFNLFSAFGSADYKFTEEWTAQAAFGHSERAPTLVELYADGPFLSLLQNGGTVVFGVGDPALKPEQLNQIDLGTKFNFEKLRAGINGYYSFIQQYITYKPVLAGNKAQITGLGLIQGFVFKNTPEASLAGFETYGEFDLASWLTPFATLNYTSGRDLSIGDPLPGIYPLDGRAGIRIHDSGKQPRWAVEFSARMVATQDQVSTAVNEATTPGFTIFNIRSYWLVKENLLLTAGIENLTNRNYQEAFDLRTPTTGGVFQPGFNFYTGVRWTY